MCIELHFNLGGPLTPAPPYVVEIALLDNDATKFAPRLLGIRIITTNIPSKYLSLV